MDFIHGVAGVGGRGPAVEGFVSLGWWVTRKGEDRLGGSKSWT